MITNKGKFKELQKQTVDHGGKEFFINVHVEGNLLKAGPQTGGGVLVINNQCFFPLLYKQLFH